MASAPLGSSNTAGVVASALFRTKLRRLLKGMQPAKIDKIQCKKYSPSSFGLYATAVREEDDETWEMSKALSTI